MPRVSYPRLHVFVAGTLAGIVTVVLALWPADGEHGARASLPSQPLDAVSGPAVSRIPEGMPVVELPPPPPPEPPWHPVRVRRGDSLARIFQREDLPAATLHRIVTSGAAARELRRIHPGKTLEYQLDEQGRVLGLRYRIDALERIEATREDAASEFTAQHVVRAPERRERFVQAEIDDSLFAASQRTGLPDKLTMQLAYIFQWDIDFVLDIRAGDSFNVLYEEHWIDGRKIGNGPILAAEFVNRGERYRAVRYVDSDGRADYYDPEGRSMRRAFLRAPVQFTRISSNFNLRRRHPIRKTTMPHRGIDYAAPTGTPILAAGDGTVIRATRHYASGKYVVIRHGERYKTKYLHLSRFGRGVRRGARVEQGQVIGYVGSTGWATGPHLHYEFLLSGVHRNPRTVPLPEAEPIAEAERQRFLTATRPLLARLTSFSEAERVALSEPAP